MEKTVVIMAAGMGSRYGGLKQLDKIGPYGETIIDYSIYDAVKTGFSKIVFIIREEFEALFREQIGSKFENIAKVEYVHQKIENIPKGFLVPKDRLKPWGTGHAMLSAAIVTKEPFIVINADDFYGLDAFKKSADYLEKISTKELSAALCGFYLKNTLSSNGTVSRGLCQVNSGLLTSIKETHGIAIDGYGKINSNDESDIDKNVIVSMNMWAFSPKIFTYAEKYFKDFLTNHISDPKAEFYIPTIVNKLIDKEKLGVKVIETTSEWFGVTYIEDKPEIEKELTKKIINNEYPKNLWS